MILLQMLIKHKLSTKKIENNGFNEKTAKRHIVCFTDLFKKASPPLKCSKHEENLPS